MAFDATDPDDLALLQSEEANDPIGMGYRHDGAEQILLDQFNKSENNVQSPRPTTGERLTVEILLDTPSLSDDLSHQQVSDGARLYLASFMNREIELEIEQWRPQIIDALRAQSDTVAALNALVRDMSRAEVLFGVGTEISKFDWRAARDS